MCSINELYGEINMCMRLIDEEPLNSKKRIFKIEMEIADVEKEKNHAGFRHDYSAVESYNSKINELKQKLNINYIQIYESKILSLKNQILDIIIEYYENDITINEIIEIENIEDDIYNKWFSLSDFGKNTGYLFVEFLNEDKYNWRYSNPINEVSFKSITLNDLFEKIKDHDELILVFDDDLSKNTLYNDLILSQKFIDENLVSLSNFNNDYVDIFINLKNNAGKFKESQLNYLFDIVLNRNFENCAKLFKYILDINDVEYAENIYNRLIDNKLIYLNSNSNKIGDVIVDLNVYADAFSENQIIQLCEFITAKIPFYIYSNEFINILKSNRDKLSQESYEKYYLKFIHD